MEKLIKKLMEFLMISIHKTARLSCLTLSLFFGGMLTSTPTFAMDRQWDEQSEKKFQLLKEIRYQLQDNLDLNKWDLESLRENVRKYIKLTSTEETVPHIDLLRQAGNELKDFSDSLLAFSTDRVEDCRHSLEQLTTSTQNSISSKQQITNLKLLLENRLHTSLVNQETARDYQQTIKTYLSDSLESPMPLDKGKLGQFIPFAEYNGLTDLLTEIYYYAEEKTLSDQKITDIYYEALNDFGLEEMMKNFSCIFSLARVFEEYLISRTGFLLSRQMTLQKGSTPSTKQKDQDSLDKLDREKVEIACTLFQNLTEPLAIIYKTLKQVSGNKNPDYLLSPEIKELLAASPTLLPYLQGQNDVSVDPDSCLADVVYFDRLKNKTIIEIKNRLGIVLAPPLKNLKRNERREIERQSKKEAKKKEKQPLSKSKTQSSLTQIKAKQLQLKAQPSVAKITPKQPPQNQVNQLAKKHAVQPIAPQSSSSSPKEQLDLTPRPLKYEAVSSSNSVTSSSKEEIKEQLISPKPKRWRGDVVVRRQKESKTLDLTSATKDLNLEVEQKNTPTATSSNVSESSSDYEVTTFVTQQNLSKENLKTLDLLCDNTTHPNTISRDGFFKLLEKLGIAVKGTTGSIYSLKYENKTKLMHIHEELGRNVTKRARLVLEYFGFLTK
ncbi:hypothetical protein [Candidatus Paracaedibacter symbiosus]|uniref:hypothetical protein n=1 Tax=Candidatus Paracaedibacter symbiosus TaxID=244582 RepID=UPI0005098EB4|nr:hypothetical protein [Candidatus Paracaedibacter symbiosus]